MNVNFTEDELVVISKILGYVGGNYSAYSADNKIQEALGRDMSEDDYSTVGFYKENGFGLKKLEDNIEIYIEEK